MANRQEKQPEAAAGSSEIVLASVPDDVDAPEIEIEVTHEHHHRYHNLSVARDCWVIDKHRKCCWSFLTKEEQADVFTGLKAQREDDGATFAKAIVRPNALKMIAVINTVTEFMHNSEDSPATFNYILDLEMENRENTPLYPFQHGHKWTLYVVPGVDVHIISGGTLTKAREVVDERGLADEFDQLSPSDPTLQQLNLNSHAVPTNVNKQHQDSEDEDLDAPEEDLELEEEETAKPKKKKRNRRRRNRRTNMGISASGSLGQGANDNNDHTEVVATEVSDDSNEDEVPEDNGPFVQMETEPEPEPEAQPEEPVIENTTILDAISSCGATAEDSIPDPLSVPCRRPYHDWPSVAIDPYVDFFQYPIATDCIGTYIDGPDDPRDRRTLYNYDAIEILEEDLVRMNTEHPFTSAETVPGPPIDVEGYGDADYGMYPEILRWLQHDGWRIYHLGR